MFITIEGTVPAQKNNKTVGTNRITGKIFVTSSKTVKSWQKEAERQLKLYDYAFKGDVALDIYIWNPDKRPRDLDNQASTILDALVKCGIIEDDSCKYVKSLRISFVGVDKQNPRTMLSIFPLKDTENESDR